MKKQLTLSVISGLIAALFGCRAAAQETTTVNGSPGDTKETQEVIIRKKGDKDTKLTVEINDNRVLINGKPLAEFNEDGVTINGRKMIIRDGDNIMLDLNGNQMELAQKFAELGRMKNFNFNFNGDSAMSFTGGKDYTYLGVNTEAADNGLKISQVSKESPAEKAGLQNGDIIYRVDDTKIETTQALSEMIRGKKDGDNVRVYFTRDGKKKDVKAVLQTQKNTVRSFTFVMPDGGMKSFSMPHGMGPRAFGNDGGNNDFEFRTMPNDRHLGIKIQDTPAGGGVKVLSVEPASAAATAGLLPDDIITEIGGVKINSTDDARQELQNNRDRSSYTIKATRNGAEISFTVSIPKKLKTANL